MVVVGGGVEVTGVDVLVAGGAVAVAADVVVSVTVKVVVTFFGLQEVNARAATSIVVRSKENLFIFITVPINIYTELFAMSFLSCYRSRFHPDSGLSRGRKLIAARVFAVPGEAIRC